MLYWHSQTLYILMFLLSVSRGVWTFCFFFPLSAVSLSLSLSILWWLYDSEKVIHCETKIGLPSLFFAISPPTCNHHACKLLFFCVFLFLYSILTNLSIFRSFKHGRIDKTEKKRKHENKHLLLKKSSVWAGTATLASWPQCSVFSLHNK